MWKPAVIAGLAAGFLWLIALATSETASADATVFNNACRTCHSWKEGDNRLGPSLHGIVGKKAGSVEGFAYSNAMKNAGITWDEATLDKFIASPEAVVAGNNMKPYTGIDDADTRQKIIAFLKTNPQ